MGGGWGVKPQENNLIHSNWTGSDVSQARDWQVAYIVDESQLTRPARTCEKGLSATRLWCVIEGVRTSIRGLWCLD